VTEEERGVFKGRGEKRGKKGKRVYICSRADHGFSERIEGGKGKMGKKRGKHAAAGLLHISHARSGELGEGELGEKEKRKKRGGGTCPALVSI